MKRWVGFPCLAAIGFSAATAAAEAPKEVPGFVPAKPGEHPRLLFRKADVPKLREKAKTPEGQAILKRLRFLLDGANGDTLTPQNKWTISTVAGYGFLYQITGDKKYADLARQAQEMAYDKRTHDCTDGRYSFSVPDGALRAGPAIGYGTLAYDLVYDGWDEDYRQKFAKYIENYNAGSWRSLPELSRGARHHPRSNHWGMQVGGAALALLGIMNDPGVDMAKIDPLLKENQKAMFKNMNEGFGISGHYAEGDGTGSMSSHIAFLPALQAWRTAAGKDFYSVNINGQWAAMRWFFLTVPTPGKDNLRGDFPERGGYPQNIWRPLHAYFGTGFGVATPDQRAAMLWFFNHTGVKEIYEKRGGPYDTSSLLAHNCILAFVNWPQGEKEKNPAEVLGHSLIDHARGYYAWRNRWQDVNDTVISIMTKKNPAGFNHGLEKTLTIRSQGKTSTWGKIGGFDPKFTIATDGSTIAPLEDMSCLAIDFSQASGAEVMLALAGPAAGADAVNVGGQKVSFAFFGKETPQPKIEGNKVIIGGQTLTFDGSVITLGKFAQKK